MANKKSSKNRIVRKSFVFCSPGNILSCHLVEGREPKYFWINNNCSPGRLNGEQNTTFGRRCLAFVFCSPMGRPGEQNTTVLRTYRILFVFHSPFSRHSALNTNKKTKGGYVSDSIRKIIARAPVCRTKNALKNLLHILFANMAPRRPFYDQMPIIGRIRNLLAHLSDFVRPRVAQATTSLMAS